MILSKTKKQLICLLIVLAAQLLPEVRSKSGGAIAPLLETMTDKVL